MENDTASRPRLLNVDQAAEYAGVGRHDVLSWIRERGLRAFPVGKVGKRGPRDYRMYRAWLDEFIEANSVCYSPAPPSGKAPKPVGTPPDPRPPDSPVDDGLLPPLATFLGRERA